MAKEPKKTTTPEDLLVENDITNTPVVFFEGVQGVLSSQRSMTVNLFQTAQIMGRAGEPAELRKVIAARLVAHPDTMREFAVYLLESLGAQVEVKMVEPEAETDGN